MKKMMYFLLTLFVMLVPTCVYAETNFDKYLTNGKLVIKSVEPQNDDQAAAMIHYTFGYNYSSSFSNNYTKCSLTDRQTGENIKFDVVYEYDKNIKKKIDDAFSKTKNTIDYYATGLEVINRKLYDGNNFYDNFNNPGFLRAMNNYNLTVYWAEGGDMMGEYEQAGGGMLVIKYGDTIYSFGDDMGVGYTFHWNNILYVDDSTNEANVLSVVDKKIKSVFGNIDTNLTFYSDTLTDLPRSIVEKQEGKNIKVIDKEVAFDNKLVFIIVKDSKKAKEELEFKSTDVITDISVSLVNPDFSLRNQVVVNKIDSGKAYKNIINTLNVKNSETYDIKLYNDMTNKYLTSTKAGKFEIRIPLSNNLKDKKIDAYRITDSGEIKTYNVTVKDGYAIFNTNTLGTYTLVPTITYKVKYDGNGATSGKMNILYCVSGEKYKLANNKYKKYGYRFAGWNTKKDGSGTSYSNKDTILNLSRKDGKTITLYAQWEKQYTVTYVLDKGKNNSNNPDIFYDNNEKIVLLEPTRKGYTFGGWYSDKKKTKQVKNIKANQRKNLTLYAKWSKNKYYVVYDANGGTGSMKKSTIKYDNKFNLTKNTFTKKGYTFTGWNTKANGTGKTYKNKQEIKNLTNKNKKTITLYAMWKKNVYYVSYDANGGKGKMDDLKVKYDNKFNLTENTFTRKGYTFIGWNTKADGTGKTYFDKTSVKNLSSKNNKVVKLYAQWSQISSLKLINLNNNEYVTIINLSSDYSDYYVFADDVKNYYPATEDMPYNEIPQCFNGNEILKTLNINVKKQETAKKKLKNLSLPVGYHNSCKIYDGNKLLPTCSSKLTFVSDSLNKEAQKENEKLRKQYDEILNGAYAVFNECGDYVQPQKVLLTEKICKEYNLNCDRW